MKYRAKEDLYMIGTIEESTIQEKGRSVFTKDKVYNVFLDNEYEYYTIDDERDKHFLSKEYLSDNFEKI